MEKKKKLKIRWDESALNDLRSIDGYLSLESYKLADKVIDGIIKSVDNLEKFPRKFPFQENLKDMGDFRFFVKWNYKIIYEITDEEIIIVFVFHTKQNPERLI